MPFRLQPATTVRPPLSIEWQAGEGFKPGFELFLAEQKQPFKNLLDYGIEALVEGTDMPKSWEGNGSLPWGEAGLKATRIVAAIVKAADTGREVEVE